MGRSTGTPGERPDDKKRGKTPAGKQERKTPAADGKGPKPKKAEGGKRSTAAAASSPTAAPKKKQPSLRDSPLLPEFLPASTRSRKKADLEPNPDRLFYADYSPAQLQEIFAEKDWMNVWERCERFADGECYILSIERHFDRSLAMLAYHLQESPPAPQLDQWVEDMLDRTAELLLDEDDRDIPNAPRYAEPLLQEFNGDVEKAAAARRALNAEPHVVRAAFLHMALDGISEFYFADLLEITPERAREALARALEVSGYEKD